MANEQLSYTIFHISVGWIGILGSPKGLLCTTLPQPSVRAVRQILDERVDHAACYPGGFSDLAERLKSYFSGRKVSFPGELDLSGATPFQRRVWESARSIAYGETRSYSWVAEQAGKPGAARATGQALARNPLPIVVPCHRVIAGDGRLGGFGGGLEMKRYLLSLEASAK